jgi:diguanylate cyclase (GGDEF)-like protein
MDMFWASLAPFSVFAAFGITVLVVVFVLWTAAVDARSVLGLGAAVFLLGAALLLPAEYYLVKSRLDGPVTRLERELRGELPWRPENDVILAPLRLSVQAVRDAALEATGSRARDQEHIAELHLRIEEHAAAERFAARVADGLGGAEVMTTFASEVARLVREVWPADHVLLLGRAGPDADFQVLFHDGADGPRPATSGDGSPHYRKAALPVPIKEAIRRGFYAESGLPFSHDPAFPEARSFVALSLDHRGAAAGVLLAVSSALVTPTAETLRRAQPFFSVGFSRSQYLREMKEAAIRDALTGAFTYDYFLSMLRHEVARSNRYSRPLTCVIVDIDGLRRINEAHGARAGDQVIGEVTQIVQSIIRSSDVLARISGGQLAMLLPECPGDAGVVVAERVLTAMAEHPFIVQRQVVERVTVSIGISVHPPHGVTALNLVDAAHRALRQAKAEGRNRVALVDESTPQEE